MMRRRSFSECPNVLIIGATSSIAAETAKLFAQHGSSFFLVSRDHKKQEILKNKLLSCGASGVYGSICDLTNFSGHVPMLNEAWGMLGTVDVMLVAHGVLFDQELCWRDTTVVRKTFDTNLLSSLSILMVAAERFIDQGNGTIAAICSVAGDRGRRSNYFYGASKAALAVFLQGLRADLWEKGVHVLTVKPGLVRTPMTNHLPQSRIFATPHSVATDIYRAIIHKKDVLYTPWFWKWIMLAVNAVPEAIFKKIKF